MTGQLVGTPRYLSPEQALGQSREIGPAADIHAIGVILFELLTARVPFPGPTVFDFIRQIAQDDALFTATEQKRLPRDLQIICLKCLEKNPYQRYESAQALAEDLESFSEGMAIRARPISSWSRAWRWCMRYPIAASLAASLVLLLMLFAVGSFTAAVLLEHQRGLAQQAESTAVNLERERRNDLFRSLIDFARSRATTGSLGQRFVAMQAIRSALDARPLSELSRGEAVDLANGTVASVAQADLQEINCYALRAVGDVQVDVDPEFRTMVSANPQDTATILRDLHAKLPTVQLSVHSDEGRTISARKFSPQGHWVLESCSSGAAAKCQVWERSTGRLAMDIPYRVFSFSFSFHPNDQVLAYNDNGRIHVCDLQSGDEVHTSEHRFPQGRLSYSPDGRILALATNDTGIEFIDAETWVSTPLRSAARLTQTFAWHPSGQSLVACTDEGKLYHYDIATARGRYLTSEAITALQIEFSPDGRFFAVSGNGLTTLFRTDGLERLMNLPGWLVRFSRGGDEIAVSNDDLLTIYRIAESPCRRSVNCGGEAAALSHDGTMVASSGPAGVQLYESDRLSWRTDLELDYAGPVTFAPRDSAFVTFGTFSGANYWPISGAETRLFGPPQRILISAPRGKTGLGLQPQHRGRHVAFSSDGRLLAVADYRYHRILLVDRESMGVRTTVDFDNPVRVALSNDGRYLAAAAVDPVRIVVWKLDTLQTVMSLADLAAMDFSDDGALFACRTSWGVQVYECNGWQLRNSFGLRLSAECKYFPIVFQPHSHRLAVSAKDGVHLLDIDGADQPLILPHDGKVEISDLSFDGRGSQLAVTRAFADVTVWNLNRLQAELRQIGLTAGLVTEANKYSTPAPFAVAVDRGNLRPGSEWFRAWWTMAGYEALQERWPDSISAIDNALRSREPNKQIRAKMLTARGDALWHMNRHREALEDWQGALNLDSSEIGATRRLAEAYILGPSSFRDLKRGVALAATLASLDNNNPAGDVLLAMAQCRLGLKGEGLRHLDAVADDEEWAAACAIHKAFLEATSNNQQAALAMLEVARTMIAEQRQVVSAELQPRDLQVLIEEIEAMLRNPMSDC